MDGLRRHPARRISLAPIPTFPRVRANERIAMIECFRERCTA